MSPPRRYWFSCTHMQYKLHWNCMVWYQSGDHVDLSYCSFSPTKECLSGWTRSRDMGEGKLVISTGFIFTSDTSGSHIFKCNLNFVLPLFTSGYRMPSRFERQLFWSRARSPHTRRSANVKCLWKENCVFPFGCLCFKVECPMTNYN